MVFDDLDRVSAWLIVNGYVNAEPGYPQTTAVMNPCSELIIDLCGTDAGSHARTAIGVATVTLNLPVVISAKVEIAPPTLKPFDQGNCIGTHRACLCIAPTDPHLRRETAAYGPLAPAPPGVCCIRKG